jgi:hypothetical protein
MTYTPIEELHQCKQGTSAVGSRHLSTASENYEGYLCAVGTVIVGVCNSERSTYLWLQVEEKNKSVYQYKHRPSLLVA